MTKSPRGSLACYLIDFRVGSSRYPRILPVVGLDPFLDFLHDFSRIRSTLRFKVITLGFFLSENHHLGITDDTY